MGPFRFLIEVASIVLILAIFGNAACEATADQWLRFIRVVVFLVILGGVCSLGCRVQDRWWDKQ